MKNQRAQRGLVVGWTSPSVFKSLDKSYSYL